MNIKGFMSSNKIAKIVIALAVILVLLLVFEAGVFVGYRKASFSMNWDRHYMSGLDDPRSIFAPFTDRDETMNPHGAMGDIVSVNLPSLMIKGPNSAEEVVVIGPNTVIRSLHSIATSTDLKAGRQVIVIGEPDAEGKIAASFVRILPSPLPLQTANANQPQK